MTGQGSDGSDDDYVVIVSNDEDQLGLTRSYSDSQVLYTTCGDEGVQLKSTSERKNSIQTKPPRPPPPKRNSTRSLEPLQYPCILFRELTPSPSPILLSENDPPYQTPIDALQSPLNDTPENKREQVVRTVSDCPVRLVKVRGSSRRKHQPLKRVSIPSPPPLLKSLSLDCLDSLNDHDSDDDYEEIYSNPFDCIDTTAAGSKPIHVTACLSISSAGIPRTPSRESTSSQNAPPVQSNFISNVKMSRSVECLDTITSSNDNPGPVSALLERRRLRNRHASLDDSVRRLREKKGLRRRPTPRKASLEIQTYPESPQHLRGVGSQENLFFEETSTTQPVSSVIKEESIDSGLPNKKTSSSGSPKAKHRTKKMLNPKLSRGGLTNLFKKKPKDT